MIEDINKIPLKKINNVIISSGIVITSSI